MHLNMSLAQIRFELETHIIVWTKFELFNFNSNNQNLKPENRYNLSAELRLIKLNSESSIDIPSCKLQLRSPPMMFREPDFYVSGQLRGNPNSKIRSSIIIVVLQQDLFWFRQIVYKMKCNSTISQNKNYCDDTVESLKEKRVKLSSGTTQLFV